MLQALVLSPAHPHPADDGSAEERWTAVLAPAGSGRSILSVTAHAPGEAVASPARVLGSGELRFKYLNPNTLLVAVGRPSPGSGVGGGSEGSDEPKLTVVLLDAVTGRLLFSQNHEVQSAGRFCSQTMLCHCRLGRANNREPGC
jgi:hypothetical protein